MSFKKKLKALIPPKILKLKRLVFSSLELLKIARTRHLVECPICGNIERFHVVNWFFQFAVICPNCFSQERHRLFCLWLQKNHTLLKPPLLHFAPEACLENMLKQRVEDYTTADLFQTADLKLNIESLELEEGSYSSVICNHVFEHVDDHKAMREVFRVLKPGGILMTSVPLIEGWESTYENPNVKTPEQQVLHFGQNDHIRYYGRDFRDRLKAAGFSQIDEYTAEGENVVKYGLMRGEKVFICHKP